MIGIIGGSGFHEIEGFALREKKDILTPYGAPSNSYLIGEFSGRDVVFFTRHGLQHNIPPHMINYRANIWGFKELGVNRIISLGATGGISHDMKPGAIIVLDQIIDMTKGRDITFYDGRGGVVHIDFTEPYCPELRESILTAGNKSGVSLKKSGTYVCVNGPRLESKAEIIFFSRIGADVVGMTAMPEASLSREAALCYAGICVVTNYAAGITGKRLTTTEVIETMKETAGRLKDLLKETLTLISSERKCSCKDALKEARM